MSQTLFSFGIKSEFGLQPSWDEILTKEESKALSEPSKRKYQGTEDPTYKIRFDAETTSAVMKFLEGRKRGVNSYDLQNPAELAEMERDLVSGKIDPGSVNDTKYIYNTFPLANAIKNNCSKESILHLLKMGADPLTVLGINFDSDKVFALELRTFYELFSRINKTTFTLVETYSILDIAAMCSPDTSGATSSSAMNDEEIMRKILGDSRIEKVITTEEFFKSHNMFHLFYLAITHSRPSLFHLILSKDKKIRKDYFDKPFRFEERVGGDLVLPSSPETLVFTWRANITGNLVLSSCTQLKTLEIQGDIGGTIKVPSSLTALKIDKCAKIKGEVTLPEKCILVDERGKK
ncbi:hypothetical protein AGMMS49949_00890 [Alphaproteobacteria bacterium]|nr:hypothetical protein AGMMS49949_00890 [Alphaproteobacteria bacterium]GHS96221.1 hypothetical protein AGMMS50296_2160 [Alphaproteobacteria bacterium]